MTDSLAPFISELIRAANEVDRLTKRERAGLLNRAALTIREYREQIAFSGTPANDGHEGDIVVDLREMARLIDVFSADEVAEQLLEAVSVIKAGRALLEAKHEIQGGGTGL